jgi:regulator of extracellular matrix RemA (YlzA/DUF370 family)
VRLINIGFGSLAAARRVVAVVSPESAPMKRLIQDARDEKNLVDATFGRRTRSVILTDCGKVLLSSLNPETIAGRIHETEGGTQESD